MLDRFIVREIEKKYPLHSILTEEGGYIDKGSEYLWIVDPIDGTSNFASGNPLFSVSIALMKEKQLLLGAIYAPAINEFYFAKRNTGAYLNGKRIHVSSISKLKRAYMYQCEGAEKNRKKTIKLVKLLYPKVLDIRKLGSASIEAAWVALGRGDAYVTTSEEAWDVAAAVLLVEEAGGKVTDFKGKKWRPRRTNLVFSNKKLHKQILNIIKKYR